MENSFFQLTSYYKIKYMFDAFYLIKMAIQLHQSNTFRIFCDGDLFQGY